MQISPFPQMPQMFTNAQRVVPSDAGFMGKNDIGLPTAMWKHLVGVKDFQNSRERDFER